MKIEKFTKIFDVFKTQHAKNVQLADENFYKALEFGNINQDTLDMIAKYINAGFIIKKSHSKYVKSLNQYLGLEEGIKIKDPLFYIWKVFSHYGYFSKMLTTKEINDSDYSKINDIVELIWEKGLEEKYRDYFRKEHEPLKEFIKNSQSEAISSIRTSFFNIRGFKYYMEEIGIKELSSVELKNLKKGLENCANNLIAYKLAYQEEKQYINYLISELDPKEQENTKIKVDEKTQFNENTLNSIYGSSKREDKILMKKEASDVNTEDLSMIKTLKLLGRNFTTPDTQTKILYEAILTDMKEIIKSEKYIEDIQIKVTTSNLLHKHLPEVLYNYFELPDKYKFDFQDSNGKTPHIIFLETLNEIKNKVTSIVDSIYTENINNIKVKNRFMKST